ncbi:hypothetical protein QTP88_007167 [Uroleucon formosanum]
MPRVCEFYLRGQCRYGVKCWNLHEVEPSMRQAVADAEREEYNRHLAECARKVAIIDAFLENLPDSDDERPESNEEILDRVRVFERNERPFIRNNPLFTPPRPYASLAQSTSTNALIAQEHSGRLAQSTSTTGTNALIGQEHSGRLAQSTSTTGTNALIAQEHSGRLAQSTSTSTTITNALITQLRVQDNCAGPSQSTSTNSTNSLITQEQELQSQLEASMRPILKQPEIVENKLSVAMKKGNGNSEKETASNFHALNQKKIEESTDNQKNTVWDDILLSAIDSDLLCNICFEIFIKPTVLSCSHTFCESCIHTWTSRVVACPICRKEVRSKSYCLTLESFIEKIVEHLPKEIKDKREVAIKDRINVKIERPQRATSRFSRRGLSGMYPQQRALSPSEYQFPMNENADFNTDVLYDESDIFRMNLHDTVVSTRGVNPLMSYAVRPEERTSNRRTNRSYNNTRR